MGNRSEHFQLARPNIDISLPNVISGIVYAPFDKGLKMLAQNGLGLISLRQNAELRIQQGKDAYVSKKGNWVREGVIYTPNGKPRLVRNSPIIASARRATKAHRNDEDFYLTSQVIEIALADSTSFPQSDLEIPTNRFGSNDLMVYSFGGEKLAEDYGTFLREAGIEKMPVLAVDRTYVDGEPKPFARQLRFSGFGRLCEFSGFRSRLVGTGRSFYSVGGVRGVRYVNSVEDKNEQPAGGQHA